MCYLGLVFVLKFAFLILLLGVLVIVLFVLCVLNCTIHFDLVWLLCCLVSC